MKTAQRKKYEVRKARLSDVKNIHALINKYAKHRVLLARSLNYIYDNVRDFYICENSRKKIVACCALHISWEDLAEVKSLAVEKNFQEKGIGKELLTRCLDEAKYLGVKRVFALTYIPQFFLNSGFKRTNKSKLPAKIWRECIDCSLFPNCDEIAVIRTI